MLPRLVYGKRCYKDGDARMGTDQIPVSKRANLAERLVVQQMQKKALGQVLSFVSVVSMAPDKCINRVPVNSAQQRIRRPSYRKSSVSVTSLNSTISLFLNTFFQLLWRIVAVDFPARNLGYLLSAVGQAPPQRRQDDHSNGAPVYPRGSFRFAGILPRLPA